mmetsp:Transcript_28261/g.74132  ORF Transcript_28261/g.74132 Transcript_28261/m.74132 type:complete len:201 (+) Transcript_28261:1150-1752(+)
MQVVTVRTTRGAPSRHASCRPLGGSFALLVFEKERLDLAERILVPKGFVEGTVARTVRRAYGDHVEYNNVLPFPPALHRLRKRVKNLLRLPRYTHANLVDGSLGCPYRLHLPLFKLLHRDVRWFGDREALPVGHVDGTPDKANRDDPIIKDSERFGSGGVGQPQDERLGRRLLHSIHLTLNNLATQCGNPDQAPKNPVCV